MTSPWQRLAALVPAPEAADLQQRQTRWLLDCLARNRDTRFGLEHRFARINSIREYRMQVPMTGYAGLAASIARMAAGDADILFQGRPVAFELTGGSSSGSKLLPYSSHSLADFSRSLLPWLGGLIKRHGITSGCAYLAVSPATRQTQTTAGGTPIGLADAAYLGAAAIEPLQALSALPPWVGEIPDVSRWQLATLYWLLRSPHLTLISLWSPSFMLQLLDALDARADEFQRLLHQGAQIDSHPLPADPEALERLRQYLRERDSRQLWPDLKLVSCWMDGASRSLAEALRQRLPHARFEGKGLLATEGVITVPDLQGDPVLAADSGFYEFLQADRVIHSAWELQVGETYEVVLTSAGGLYRYRTGDRVHHVGMQDDLPVLRFIGRDSLSTDLVGEKLTEAFVAQCLTDIPGFRALAAVTAPAPHYTLIAEPRFAPLILSRLDEIETCLKTNPQYAYARKLGQLAPLTAKFHPAPLKAYVGIASRRQRLGDVKVPALLPLETALKLLEEWP